MGEQFTIPATFAALSDPTRIAILQQLLHGPARVTELAVPHDMSLNSVSKHVKILEGSRLVTRNVRGREHWIHFNEAPLAEAHYWAGTMLIDWAKNLDALKSRIASDQKAGRIPEGEADEAQ